MKSEIPLNFPYRLCGNWILELLTICFYDRSELSFQMDPASSHFELCWIFFRQLVVGTISVCHQSAAEILQIILWILMSSGWAVLIENCLWPRKLCIGPVYPHVGFGSCCPAISDHFEWCFICVKKALLHHCLFQCFTHISQILIVHLMATTVITVQKWLIFLMNLQQDVISHIIRELGKSLSINSSIELFI